MEERQGPFDLSTLPPELLAHLARFMDNSSCLALACTGRRLYYTFTPRIWQRVVLDVSSSGSDKYVDGVLAEFPRCHTLDGAEAYVLTARDVWFFSALQDERLASLARHSVQHMTIHYDAAAVPDPRRLCLLAQRFRSLTTLRLIVLRGPAGPFLKYIRPLAMRVRQRVDLHLGEFAMLHALSDLYAGKVGSLRVDGTALAAFDDGAGPYILNTWVERMVNLEHLELHLADEFGIPPPRMDGRRKWLWPSTFEKLGKLKSFAVHSRNTFDIFSPLDLPVTVKHLALSLYEIPAEGFRFDRVKSVVLNLNFETRRTPRKLGLRFPYGLSHLEINGAVSAEQLRGLIENSPDLESLTGAFHTAQCDLGYVGTMCRRLKRLHIRDVRQTPAARVIGEPVQARGTTLQYFSNTMPDAMLGTLRDLRLEEDSDEEESSSDDSVVIEWSKCVTGSDADDSQESVRSVDVGSDVTSQDAPTTIPAPTADTGHTTLFQLISVLRSFPNLVALVLYFPFDLLSRPVYKQLIQLLPRLDTIFLLYRPDHVLAKRSNPRLVDKGVYKHIKAFPHGARPNAMVYKVDIAGYRFERRAKSIKAAEADGPAKDLFVEGKCMYCIGTGQLDTEQFV